MGSEGELSSWRGQQVQNLCGGRHLAAEEPKEAGVPGAERRSETGRGHETRARPEQGHKASKPHERLVCSDAVETHLMSGSPFKRLTLAAVWRGAVEHPE